MCDAGHFTGDFPELLRGGSAHDGCGRDFAGSNLFGEDVVAAAGAIGHFSATDEPGSHVLLRDAKAEIIEKATTGGAAFKCVAFKVATIWAKRKII